MDKLNSDIPTGLKAVLSNPMLDSVIKQQAMVQKMISPPLMNALTVQQNLISKQAITLQPTISMSEMVSKSLAPALSSLAIEATRAFQVSIPRFDDLTKSLMESIRPLQINFPKVDYLSESVRTMTSSLQNLSDAFIPMAEQMSKITQGFADAFRFQIPELVKTIPPFDFSAFSHLSETFSHIRDFEEKNDLLKSFGWFLISELPDEIVDTIYERKNEITQEEVDALIVQYFRNNRCAALKQMVNSWRDLPYFESRKDVFHQALVCHSRRIYNASTTMLSLHFEGVVTDFVRENMPNPMYHGEKALQSVTNLALEMPMNVMPFTDWIICRCVLACVDQTFTEKFSVADPDSCPNSSRHKIAHGHATEKETEANSLRRFLYMNEMYKLFSCLESKLQIVA